MSVDKFNSQVPKRKKGKRNEKKQVLCFTAIPTLALALLLTGCGKASPLVPASSISGGTSLTDRNALAKINGLAAANLNTSGTNSSSSQNIGLVTTSTTNLSQALFPNSVLFHNLSYPISNQNGRNIIIKDGVTYVLGQMADDGTWSGFNSENTKSLSHSIAYDSENEVKSVTISPPIIKTSIKGTAYYQNGVIFSSDDFKVELNSQATSLNEGFKVSCTFTVTVPESSGDRHYSFSIANVNLLDTISADLISIESNQIIGKIEMVNGSSGTTYKIWIFDNDHNLVLLSQS